MASTASLVIVGLNDSPVYEAELGSALRVSSGPWAMRARREGPLS